MTGTDPEDRQATVDIHRARVLLSLDQGIDMDASTRALKVRAALDGVSLHAAALAVLSPDPVDRPVEVRPEPTGWHRRHRHLFAVPSSGGDPASTGEIQSRR